MDKIVAPEGWIVRVVGEEVWYPVIGWAITEDDSPRPYFLRSGQMNMAIDAGWLLRHVGLEGWATHIRLQSAGEDQIARRRPR